MVVRGQPGMHGMAVARRGTARRVTRVSHRVGRLERSLTVNKRKDGTALRSSIFSLLPTKARVITAYSTLLLAGSPRIICCGFKLFELSISSPTPTPAVSLTCTIPETSLLISTPLQSIQNPQFCPARAFVLFQMPEQREKYSC